MIRAARLLTVLACAAGLLAGCGGSSPGATPTTAPSAALEEQGELPDDDVGDRPSPHDAALKLAALEAEHDAVIGLFALDTGSGATVEHRADERFAYASTHKAFSAAAVLLRSTPRDIERGIVVDVDIQPHSPVTGPAAGATLTLRDVLRAAIIESDNTAGNLLLAELGGPQGFEAALRSVGDEVTSADRWETELNDWVPGEERDTTTPRQAAETLRSFLFGDVLQDWARDELLSAMRDVTSAAGLVRAAAPADAVVGNKSGASGHGVRADIAVIDQPSRLPVVIAVYTYRLDPDADWSDELVADAARIALAALGPARDVL